MSGAVEHPKHYTQGKIECIDFIEDQDFNFRIGNAVKYLTRYRSKGTAVEDLKKAIWYIKREIQKLEQTDERSDTRRPPRRRRRFKLVRRPVDFWSDA